MLGVVGGSSGLSVTQRRGVYAGSVVRVVEWRLSDGSWEEVGGG